MCAHARPSTPLGCRPAAGTRRREVIRSDAVSVWSRHHFRRPPSLFLPLLPHPLPFARRPLSLLLLCHTAPQALCCACT
ncbi:unnamed protein product [Mycena citricolor]|uniref:Uncharacterized protein n=1 Tax=Mycena citricolor TaxID=2018698 RepID=A0AAD2GW58_9AGAR|nr:unnamed protein product [Mycena citricolor]